MGEGGYEENPVTKAFREERTRRKKERLNIAKNQHGNGNKQHAPSETQPPKKPKHTYTQAEKESYLSELKKEITQELKKAKINPNRLKRDGTSGVDAVIKASESQFEPPGSNMKKTE